MEPTVGRDARSGHWRRLLLWAPAALLVVALAVVAWELKGILSPSTSAPSTEVDAVVVLAGGRGERIDTALELMAAQDPAPVLVISAGNRRWNAWPELEPFCSEPQPFPVECVSIEPDTTRGEAAGFAELAEERGWDDLAVVTSDYHIERADLLFRRCFDGDIHAVGAPADAQARFVRHELFGTLYAKFLGRSCTSS